MTIVLLACIVGCASSILPASPTKREKIERMMQLQGVYETMNHQREVGREQMLSIFQQQLDAMRDEFPSTSPELLFGAERAMQRFADEFATIWDPEELVPLWVEYYGEQLTEGDVDQILAYWESPAGRRDAAATRSATPLYLAEIERRTSGSMERALTEFLEFLRLQRRLNR